MQAVVHQETLATQNKLALDEICPGTAYKLILVSRDRQDLRRPVEAAIRRTWKICEKETPSLSVGNYSLFQ
jgi:hypothetical protein